MTTVITNSLGQPYVSNGKVLFAPEVVYNNYIKNGSPTVDIVNGTASGFSSSNYLTLAVPFSPYTNTWEIRLKIKTSTISAEHQRFFHSCGNLGYNYRFGIVFGIENGNFNLAVSTTSTSWNNNHGTHVVQANTTYWIKVSFDGTTYKLSYSLDGETYTQDISFTTGAVNYELRYSFWGIFSGNGFATPFLGEIDLSKCYIKIGDTIFWTAGQAVPR